jgi:toxin ParE1/3/4
VTQAYQLRITPRAAADMADIGAYITQSNPTRSATFVAELEAKCRSAAAHPELYPVRDDLAPGIRLAVHGHYLVLYRVVTESRTVRIVRVLHSARDVPRLL